MTVAVLPAGHGVREYVRGICRCDELCQSAWREYGRRARQIRLQKTRRNGGIAPVKRHNRNTYANWGCQCPVCLAAQEAYAESRRARG